MSDLQEFLAAQGVSKEEIAEAEAQGPEGLRLLLLDWMLLQASSHLTQKEVAERAGVPIDVARRFWVAMGFVEPDPEDRIFNEGDVEALRTAGELIKQQITHPLLALQQTRIMGLSMSRVAEAAISAWRERRVMPLRADDEGETEVDEPMIAATRKLLQSNERFLVYIWRRHLAAAAKRLAASEMETTDEIPLRGIGFADLVGFTRISQSLDDAELAELVERFEVTTHETIATGGGRLVKMIGDEVMFVAEDPLTTVEIGLALSARHEEDTELPSIRVGLAWGPVLVREGDYYGQTVNLANRIVKAARPGTVVVNEELQEKLAERQDLNFRRVPAPPLKDIGRVRLWRVRRETSDERQPAPAVLAEGAREAAVDLTDGTIARVSEAAEEALAKAAYAVDGALEKATTSATGKVTRHRDRKEAKKARRKVDRRSQKRS
jgi:adenylate cyclase